MVFKMSWEDLKTHKEIAAELNIFKKTVNNHLRKASKDFSESLAKEKTSNIKAEQSSAFILLGFNCR